MRVISSLKDFGFSVFPLPFVSVDLVISIFFTASILNFLTRAPVQREPWLLFGTLLGLE